MQRLRSTFKRSRTPTGAEMKSQSSLEVPKQVRSASFDEIQLEAKRHDVKDLQTQNRDARSSACTTRTTSSSSSSCSPGRSSQHEVKSRMPSTLRVPQLQSGQRSKSFDVCERNVLLGTGLSATSQKRQAQLSSMGRSTGFSTRGKFERETPLIQLSGCYHCACVEEYKNLYLRTQDDDEDEEEDNDNEDEDREDENDGKIDANDYAGYKYDVASGGRNEDDFADEDDDEEYEDELDLGDVVSRQASGHEDETEMPEMSARNWSPSTDEDDNKKRGGGSPEIRVTLTTNSYQSYDKSNLEFDTGSSDGTEVRQYDFVSCDRQQRRRSVASPRLSRQEALTSFPPELPAIRGLIEDEDLQRINDYEDDAASSRSRNSSLNSPPDRPSRNTHLDHLDDNKTRLVVRDIFLTVPELKRDRAASVDSCFNNNKNGKNPGGIGVPGDSDSLNVPQQNVRSKSVDIVLPTEAQTRYTALLPPNETRPSRGRQEGGGSSGGHREPRSTPDWGNDALNGEHLWVPTAASGDFCYMNDCSKHGPRVKCAACRVVAHLLCAGSLSFECKPSFRDVGVRQYREQTSTHHHWVHRRSQKGKCANCGKAFQSKLSFSSKEIVAVSCSWCKAAYHNKEACFNVQKIGENCELGSHASIIVPPSWIVKLPRKGSFKSSLRKSPRKKKSGGGSGASSRRKSKEKDKDKDDKDQGKMWIVKPIPSINVRPVIVFINPKSGGNQGAKLLQKFQWHLNPRQVFDLTQGGPKMGLELFKKVPNLRVLACGGDGTVGWVLSILDQIGANPPPAVGVLPLGTGNDLARALGWGGGYTDEPIGKILSNMGESETTLLDRWQLTVERNQNANDDDGGKGKESLPLNVVNNYFSLGVDAHIALEFHEAREAHPEKFNSRLRNKMFYGQMGGKDLVIRKWKDLSEFVTLECDGQDMTPKLKEHRVHAIVFLNIASYGGGTHPWGATSGTKEPSTEDGLIEVVGLTTFQLPLLQAGGHGTCIAQCSKAKLITTRTIPMQVDGEACRLLPSIIEMSLLNKATMLAKRRSSSKPQQNTGVKLESLKLPVMRIKMSDYEAFHSDKDRLKRVAVSCLAEPLDIDATTDLEALRKILSKDQPMDACCFLDSCTAERFFRIDRAQEQLHYVTDVAVEAVYILDENLGGQMSNESDGGRNSHPEPETAQASPSEERSDRMMTMREEKPVSNERPRDSPHVSRQASERPEDKPSVPADKPPPMSGHSSITKSDSRPKKSVELPPEVSYVKNDDNAEPMSNKLLAKQTSSKAFSATTAGQSQHQNSSTFISPRDRLFGLSSEVHSFSSGLLEKTCDGILRAAKIGDLKALRELHERGFSLLSIDANGQTALHVAARHGHKDIVRYLIACAPPTILNMVDNDKGQTALHKAAQQKRRSICCMLVAGGATLTVRDRYGNTPRELALAAEDRDLAAYLHSQEQFQLVTEDMDNGP
ncbi:eye-specific diacylglycerol kinase isoform X2 [Venturia canescens]|uniref:eye-specific diacylglycerol kinase isoform X2 n=1 Tax=Venturia canescens TaxID=32260 RepID=UPI001C9BFB7A|nr:eye-specific diacylglycerol kinase isoform X2 [Venturia canescens]